MRFSSSALTATFMSRSRQLNRTLAPASRRTRARVLSGATALVLNCPECGQAALCHPLLSTQSPHSHQLSVTAKGNLSFSRIKVRYGAASTLNSGLVGKKRAKFWAVRRRVVRPRFVRRRWVHRRGGPAEGSIGNGVQGSGFRVQFSFLGTKKETKQKQNEERDE